MKIQILLYDGFDELDAVAPYEVLDSAARRGADLHVELVTLEPVSEVTANHGLRIQVTHTLDDSADLVLVPGGGWADRAPKGTRAELERGAIPQRLAQLHRAGKTLASVCTGAMLLAGANLLEGRNATTHHSALADLREYGVHLQAARVVDDGDIITAGGVTSGLDLALWLVERYYGPTLALKVEQVLEYERRGTVWRSVRE